MWLSLARAALLTFALVTGARADDLADFNAAVETASAHNRVAIGYLRTGNLDPALLEIDRLREAWGAVERRFAGKRPAAFDGNPHYATLWTAMNARFVGIDLMISMGKPDAVRKSLEDIRGDLYELRKASGIVVLADCVRDANAGMDALMRYDTRALDFAKAQTRTDLSAQAQSYGATLARCDNIANEAVRNSAEFRRLIDGAKASLALIAKAIETRDGGLLHRVLIELRSFDNLLAFRFG